MNRILSLSLISLLGLTSLSHADEDRAPTRTAPHRAMTQPTDDLKAVRVGTNEGNRPVNRIFEWPARNARVGSKLNINRKVVEYAQDCSVTSRIYFCSMARNS